MIDPQAIKQLIVRICRALQIGHYTALVSGLALAVAIATYVRQGNRWFNEDQSKVTVDLHIFSDSKIPSAELCFRNFFPVRLTLVQVSSLNGDRLAPVKLSPTNAYLEGERTKAVIFNRTVGPPVADKDIGISATCVSFYLSSTTTPSVEIQFSSPDYDGISITRKDSKTSP